jgi:hypothetical protein
MKHILIALAFVGFLLACGPSEDDKKLDTLYAELIKGHDDVMPLSMKLPKLKTEVLASVNNLPEGDSLKTQAVEIGIALIKANEDMYTWMDAFAVAMNDVEDKKEKLVLYEKLKVDIVKIDEATHECMETAQNLLTNHE